MRPDRGTRRSSIALVALVAIVAAACGNAKTTVSHAGNAAGVTSSQIIVGGVASLTGPIPADFAPIFDGVRAYLSMVNARRRRRRAQDRVPLPARRRLERLPGHRPGAHPRPAGPRLRGRRGGDAELRRGELPRRQRRPDLRLRGEHGLVRGPQPVRLRGFLHRLHATGARAGLPGRAAPRQGGRDPRLQRQRLRAGLRGRGLSAASACTSPWCTRTSRSRPHPSTSRPT